MSDTKRLRDYPEIAIDIATYIGIFNAVEAILHLLCAQMINDEIGVTHAFLSPWNSLDKRISIIVEVAKLLKNNTQAEAILRNEKGLRELNSFRNLLAHSAYSVTDGVNALSYLVSTKTPKLTPITEEVLRDKLSTLTAVKDDLTKAIRRSTGEAVNAYTRPM
jgi:hypothetical protein